LITCLAVFPLKMKYSDGIKLPRVIPLMGVVISIYMMTQCNINQIITGLLFMALGVPIFLKYAPRDEIQQVKKDIELGRGVFSRWFKIPDKFLAYFLRRLAFVVLKIRSKI
jgi:basic amino acid/polyamine antiporter, APA family